LDKAHVIGAARRINQSAKDLLHVIQNYMFYVELDFLKNKPSSPSEEVIFSGSKVIEEIALEIAQKP